MVRRNNLGKMWGKCGENVGKKVRGGGGGGVLEMA